MSAQISTTLTNVITHVLASPHACLMLTHCVCICVRGYDTTTLRRGTHLSVRGRTLVTADIVGVFVSMLSFFNSFNSDKLKTKKEKV